MSDLISREELLKQIETDSKGHEGQYGDEWLFIDTINSIPTIEERKEGHWISHGDDQCSECGVTFPDLYPLYNSASYCPNCGAKMERRADEPYIKRD